MNTRQNDEFTINYDFIIFLPRQLFSPMTSTSSKVSSYIIFFKLFFLFYQLNYKDTIINFNIFLIN